MPEKSFTLPSFAKINLHLRVIGKRGDGYHEICTVFQTVSLHDDITFRKAEGLALTCSDPQVPNGEDNLVIRAAKALRDRFHVNAGANIHLEKRIPAPGGLGGGSSNAAVALLGLAKLWQIPADISELEAIGAELGSDVPFFFHGGTAIGTGRGEKIDDTQQLVEKFILIVTPNIQVSTSEAFLGLSAPNLTTAEMESSLNVCRFEAEKLESRHSALINDFERSVFAAEPEIGTVKERLLELGAAQALLSGSGASVFAIFDTEETRQATLKAIREGNNWRQFAVAAISRVEYREALEKVF